MKLQKNMVYLSMLLALLAFSSCARPNPIDLDSLFDMDRASDNDSVEITPDRDVDDTIDSTDNIADIDDEDNRNDNSSLPDEDYSSLPDEDYSSLPDEDYFLRPDNDTDDNDVVPVCGNGLLEKDEVCDDGKDNGEYNKCLVDCSGVGYHCGDGTTDTVYTNKEKNYANDSDYSTDNSSTVYSNIVVSEGGTVNSFKYTIDVGNDYYYLTVSIIAPDGTEHTVCSYPGECNAPTVTNATAAVPTFTGLQINGTWKLKLDTYNSTTTSHIRSFRITLNAHIYLFTETCDEGDLNGTYNHCSEDCTESHLHCGDSIVTTPNEECDDGNLLIEECNYGVATCSICDDTCHIQDGVTHVCGDKTVDTPQEICDDGNILDEGCTTYAGMCSNGITCTFCNHSCQHTTLAAPCCGDGTWDGPGGDGITSASEECDDGNGSNNDSCLNNCKLNICGDGYTDSLKESCDNGVDNNTYDNDCNATCDGAGPHCGDGLLDGPSGDGLTTGPETCDNGTANTDWLQTRDDSSCNTGCSGTAFYCGDGTKNSEYEQCDDATHNGEYRASAPGYCSIDCQGLGGGGFCGDLTTQASQEVCDDGEFNGDYNHCNATCTGIGDYCGDGTTKSGVSDTNLALYLLFDENSGTTTLDTSDNGLSGTLSASASWTMGKRGSAVAFNKTGNINIGNPLAIQITGNQTIAMWIKPNSFYNRQSPYHKSAGGEGTIILETNGALNYSYGTSGSDYTPFQVFNSVSTLTTGMWNHIAIVRDLTNMTLTWYINGIATNTTTAKYSEATASSDNASIGDGKTFPIDGAIDEFAMFSRALSEGDITTLMEIGVGGEVCDEGALNGTYGHCADDCHSLLKCGDGIVNGDEECDDGNTETESCEYGKTACTVCDATCHNIAGVPSYCGDGTVDLVYGDDDIEKNYAQDPNVHVDMLGHSRITVNDIGTVNTFSYFVNISALSGEVASAVIFAPDGTSHTVCEDDECIGKTIGTISTFDGASINGVWDLKVLNHWVNDATTIIQYFRMVINEHTPVRLEECDDGVHNGETHYCGSDCKKIPPNVIPTHQTQCYSNSDGIICPTNSQDFYGQDAQYTDATRIFTVQGETEKIVIDSMTTLEWQQSYTTRATWSEAGTYCNDLDFGGYTDWRLPAIQELSTLVHYGYNTPSIDTAVFFNPPAGGIWSSTAYPGTTDKAWYVDFQDGSLSSYDITYKLNIKCVRGTYNYIPDFVVTTVAGETIVTDVTTNLIWQQTSNNGLNWKQALAYCETLDYAGKNDWRLPNINELKTISDCTIVQPTIDSTAFPNTQAGGFWSSTSPSTLPAGAWYIHFGTGYVKNNYSKTAGFSVRCVR